MNTLSLIFTFILFVILFGEIRRKTLLKRLISNKSLRVQVVNCQNNFRILKTIILIIVAFLLMVSFLDIKISIFFDGYLATLARYLKVYNFGILDIRLLMLECSFCLLIIEQLIPTRKNI